MNKFTTSLTLISALLIAGTTHAVTDTPSAQINFIGKVTSETCDFNFGEGDDTVTLGDASQGDLQTRGATAEITPFEIKLTGCTANDDVALIFSSHLADSNFDGTLRNIVGTDAATHVNIQLLDASGNPMNLNSPVRSTTQTATGPGMIFQYSARYYATDKAKAGLVASNATVQIEYQ